LRSLLRALGTKNDARYNLKIVDVDRPEGERDQPKKATAKDEKPEPDTAEDEVAVDNSADEPVEKESDLARKTRAELADLDDLDI